MAKLNAPLFSFRASGKIANALVYFGWKGLNVVRSYVVPANPKTTLQTTHRAYLTAAVAMIHTAQGLATDPLVEADTIAYAALGSTRKTPRTWFNEIVKQWLDQKVLGKIPCIGRGATLTAGTDKVTVEMHFNIESSAVTDFDIHYGTSKTTLVNKLVATLAEIEAGKDVPNLTTGTKYYFQVRSTSPDTFDGFRSGIYYQTPT